MKIKIKGTTDQDFHDVYINGKILNLQESLRHYNASPGGFNWGYGGSGPSQLSMAILMKFMPFDEAFSRRIEFKEKYIAKLKMDENFEIELDLKDIVGDEYMKKVQSWFDLNFEEQDIIDKYGLPREYVRCPECGDIYKEKVCGNCECCTQVCGGSYYNQWKAKGQ